MDPCEICAEPTYGVGSCQSCSDLREAIGAAKRNAMAERDRQLEWLAKASLAAGAERLEYRALARACEATADAWEARAWRHRDELQAREDGSLLAVGLPVPGRAA
jgi:hypothetical protein